MSTKNASKKKSRSSLAEDPVKSKAELVGEDVENIDAGASKKKKKKADTISEVLTDHSENVPKNQEKKTLEKAPRSLSVAAGIDLQGKYDRLKARFDELKALRTTEAEALLEQQKENMQAKEKASLALIAALKQEKEGLASLVDRTSEARIAELEAKIRFYESLSGVQIREINDKKQQYSCTYTLRGDKPLALDFDLALKDEHAEYTPKSDFGGKELAALPEYLREEIVFSSKDLPMFLSKMNNHMYKTVS